MRIDLAQSDGLSVGQVIGAVLVLALTMVLLPAGARASTAFLNVLIADPTNTSQKAHVDASGNLHVTADDPGRAAFGISLTGSFTSQATDLRFTVPEGKRLVIEFVSFEARLPIGDRMTHASVELNETTAYPLLPRFVGTDAVDDITVASQDVTLYAYVPTRRRAEVKLSVGGGSSGGSQSRRHCPKRGR